MSNGHVGANCIVVTASTGILFLLTNPLGYVNPFFLTKGTVSKGTVPFFTKTTIVANGNGLVLVINGNYNGFKWKLHQKRVQQPFPFQENGRCHRGTSLALAYATIESKGIEGANIDDHMLHPRMFKQIQALCNHTFTLDACANIKGDNAFCS